MKEILRRQNSRPFLTKFLPGPLLGASVGYCQRALVDESRIIRTQMGTHNRSENGRSAWDALCDTTQQQYCGFEGSKGGRRGSKETN
jgi:hypothetical protein